MGDVNGTANTMAQALREAFETLGGIQSKITVKHWIESRYPGKWKDGTFVGHFAGCSVNNPAGIRHHRSFPRFLYDRGNGQFEIYDPEKHGSFDEYGYSSGQSPATLDVAEQIQVIAETAGKEFAYESHLRDYLARNLGLLEEGLNLWTEEGTDSIEFSLEGRRVDILAKDKMGTPVVIELKLSRGHDRTIGQALYYRAKLKQLLGASKIRVMLIASEITTELKLACSEVPDVSLFEYSLSMSVNRVST